MFNASLDEYDVVYENGTFFFLPHLSTMWDG